MDETTGLLILGIDYSVVAQKDSRINVTIAKAAKKDISSMTVIGILGTIFLPAILVVVGAVLNFYPLPSHPY
jgi:hypothetical protein